MSAFGNILRLSVGDLLARALAFFATIYLARVLGVEAYGVVEFALSILAYLTLLADGGLELWGTREVARGRDPGEIIGRVVPLRLAFAVASLAVLAAILPWLPPFPRLDRLLLLYALLLLVQVVDLRWVFMGEERMRDVATGLVIAQAAFALGVLASVRDPEDVLRVPLCQLAGSLAMATWYVRLLRTSGKRVRWPSSLAGSGAVLRSAVTLGSSRALALLSYNFDTLMLGALVGATAVGWYNAAYRPVAAVLAVSTTYFLGLFPVLSRTWATDPDEFRRIVRQSSWLTAAAGLPLAVGSLFLAEPVVTFLYGESYARSAAVLPVLAWSAVFVFLRGTFRQALCAAGHLRLDLAGAALAGGTNVLLNFLWIPRFGMLGAAWATVASEVLWLGFVLVACRRRLGPLDGLHGLGAPALAALVMSAVLLAAAAVSFPWPLQMVLSIFVYGVVLGVARREEIRAWRLGSDG